jgi:glucose-6-phosphate 1-dehydrogenase
MDIVIFGVTGHLSTTKLLPAINILKADKPELNINTIGFSRTKKKIKGLNILIDGEYSNPADINKVDKYLRKESTAFFYFAVPQNVYLPLLKAIKESKLLNKRNIKIMLEKPFGSNKKEALLLKKYLEKYFDGNNVYPIDHYSGKHEIREMKGVDIKNIDKIEIYLHESEGILNRGGFYDKVGALYDVGQNHMLYMLATVLQGFGKQRKEILRKLVYQIGEYGQYHSFRNEKDVHSESQTETYFKIKAKLKLENNSIEVLLSSGKGLKSKECKINISKKDGSEEVILVSSGHHAHLNVFKDAIDGRKEAFLDIEEIIAAWEFVEIAKKDAARQELNIYAINSM